MLVKKVKKIIHQPNCKIHKPQATGHNFLCIATYCCAFCFSQIQRQVAQGYSVIWNCKAVDNLCFCMEDIFNHGLKEGLVCCILCMLLTENFFFATNGNVDIAKQNSTAVCRDHIHLLGGGCGMYITKYYTFELYPWGGGGAAKQ